MLTKNLRASAGSLRVDNKNLIVPLDLNNKINYYLDSLEFIKDQNENQRNHGAPNYGRNCSSKS